MQQYKNVERRKWVFYPDEVLNSVTHGFGALLSGAGLVLLLVYAGMHDADAWKIVSFVIFGTSLIIMYTASALYHGTRKTRLRHYLNKFDHASIYILIAGTYTPFTLVSLRGAWGWSIFGVIWGLALAGVIYKMFFYNEKHRVLSAILYVFMGCLIVVAIGPLIRAVPAGGLYWLIAGGVSYIGGVYFYIHDRRRLNHLVWHFFVLGGSIAHFLAIFLYVLPH
jgi:hemolysin III